MQLFVELPSNIAVSEALGATPPTQFAAVDQLLFAPRPLQVMLAGAKRSSSTSTRHRELAPHQPPVIAIRFGVHHFRSQFGRIVHLNFLLSEKLWTTIEQKS
jgi:hypothetical protein